MKDLIDPLNEDTYDDRVIVSNPYIKSYLSGPAFEKFAAKIHDNFEHKRKKLWHEIYSTRFQLWKILHA